MSGSERIRKSGPQGTFFKHKKTRIANGILFGEGKPQLQKITIQENRVFPVNKNKNRQHTRGTGSPIGGSMNRSPPIAVSMITWEPATTLPTIAASLP